MLMSKKSPNEVFTPRAPQVNQRMYVQRQKLEERLIDAFNANKYIVIHGESGNGKTWLYKKVFAENGIHFDVINLGQALTAGSLENAFTQKLGEWGYSQKVGQETNSSGGFKPAGIGVDHALRTSQKFHETSPFLALLERVRFRAGNDRRAALILDNFESIIGDPNSVKQIGGLIVSADDESVAKYEVQVVIVGVPGNLKETIVSLANSAPVSNRLTELPEVARMSNSEATDLIRRGFVDELRLNFADEVKPNKLYESICFYTDRIAQHIHELCLIISQNAVRNGDTISAEVVDKSLATWTDDTLSSDSAVIEGVMNARETKAGRKNQVLYAMGVCKSEDFKYSDIEAIVRENFDVEDSTLNVSQILSGFASAQNPIIRRTPKQDAWRFVSPKFKMAIRSKMRKSEDNKVTFGPVRRG